MNNRIHVHQILARIMVRVLKTQMHTTVIVLLAGAEINVKQKYVIRTHVMDVEDAVSFVAL